MFGFRLFALIMVAGALFLLAFYYYQNQPADEKDVGEVKQEMAFNNVSQQEVDYRTKKLIAQHGSQDKLTRADLEQLRRCCTRQ